MEISFDPAKNVLNIKLRGLSFERAADFDFDTATYCMDTRRDYGETRIRAFGYLNKRLYALVFVETNSGIRVISFRKSNKREVGIYESQT